MLVDEALLDNPAALAAGDPEDMLRAVAGGGAQLRAALTSSEEQGLRRVAEDGRPRAVVVAGMGGSGQAGDMLAALTGLACPVPVVQLRGLVLPGWVGPLDLVFAVSCSGTTEETLAVAEEASRRGVRLVVVAAAGSPLAEIATQAGAAFASVDPHGGAPRTHLWSLTVPLLVIADALGLASAPPEALGAAADTLDRLAEQCAAGRETVTNPAKTLAVELGGGLPVVWGSGEVAVAAAYRLTCQLAENAKLPAIFGALPEAGHNQVVAFDGPFVAGTGADGADFFRDRVDDPPGARLHVVLLRESGEHPRVAARATALRALATDRGIGVSELHAEGMTPVERLASLVGATDFASVYLALACGVDPTPIAPITTLKERIAQ